MKHPEFISPKLVIEKWLKEACGIIVTFPKYFLVEHKALKMLQENREGGVYDRLNMMVKNINYVLV